MVVHIIYDETICTSINTPDTVLTLLHYDNRYYITTYAKSNTW